MVTMDIFTDNGYRAHASDSGLIFMAIGKALGQGSVAAISIARLIMMAIIFLASSVTLTVIAESNEVELAMATDSDGDGMSDWDEWQAGTNPGDPRNCFEITTIELGDGKVVLSWKGVATSTYEVVSSETITGLATDPQHVAFIKATGGIDPWYETLSSATNALSGSNLYIRIKQIIPQDFEKSSLDMATFE